MKQIALQVNERTVSGSGPVNQLRKQGMIPGVVYGEERKPVTLTVEARSFQRMVLGNRQSQLYKFQSQHKDLDGLVVLVKDLQFEPLKDQVLHVDFYAITEGHKITLAIPLELVGECPAVKVGDAILNQSAYEIEVECLPAEIPEMIQVDISGLEVGHAIHAQDLQLPKGVALKSDPEMSIIGALMKREEVETPAAAAPAEDAAAAATAAPAAPAKS